MKDKKLSGGKVSWDEDSALFDQYGFVIKVFNLSPQGVT